MWNKGKIERLEIILKEIQIILCEIKYDLLLLRSRETLIKNSSEETKSKEE